MKLTVDQAFQQAVDAHKTGKLQDAERLYRAILKVQPKHPDANHNLGVLALWVGKPLEALPYLKTALDTNSNHGQFWISYINALIETKQIAEAGKVLEEGRKAGLTGEAVRTLGQKLNELEQDSSQISHETQNRHSNSMAGKATAEHGSVPQPQGPSRQQVDELLAIYNTGNFQLAENQAKAIIEKYPGHPFAWNVLGVAFRSMGRIEESLEPMLQSVRLNPHDAQAHNNLGVTLKDLGRLAEAEVSFREAIRFKPDLAAAHSNLGNALRERGRLTEAEASFREAIRFKPDYAAAHSNLGQALRDRGRLAEAEASNREAIRLKPDFAQAHNSLGVTLKDLGRLAEAEASFREAIRLKPDYAAAHSNLGNALRDHGRLTEAEASNREAIRLKPDFAEAHCNLGVTLKDLGRFAEAEASFRETFRLKPDDTIAHSAFLFSLNYIASLSPEAALEEAKRYGSLVSAKAQPKFTSFPIEPGPLRLRIGFVSGDFRNHPVGYFIEGLIKHLDQRQFEIYAFPTTPIADNLTKRISPYFRDWVSIYGMTDFDAASAIHERGIHVLIDLSGHTAHNRLKVFSYKPAPVQVSWLGYFATTGLPEMDFILGDPHMSPQSEQHHFTEKVWSLAETWFCLTPPSQSVQISTLPALTNDYVTFGCFGNLAKMNDQVVKTWSDVLQRVPNSKLFLKSGQLLDTKMIDAVQGRFISQDISVDRLILEGPSSRTAYYEAHNRIDMILDTFPYPGGTTSVDALWMGVPVLTLKGDRFLSHLGESIATNAGLTNWIAQDCDDYINKAITFVSDIQSLAAIRGSLRAQVLRTPLFDTQRFARNFSDALWGMYASVGSPVQ